MNKKRISIFGATGSIGQNTLDLIARDRQSYEVVVLTAGSNIDLLVKAALEFQPQAVVAATNDQERRQYAHLIKTASKPDFQMTNRYRIC